MPSLAEVQKAFRAAILTGETRDELMSVLGSGGIEAAAGLNIHRNNYRQTLVGALYGIFPVSSAFVGEDFLRGILTQYVVQSPPAKAALMTYGAGIAAFVDTFAPADKVPYLSDIIALEWAIYDLQNSAEYELPPVEKLGVENQGQTLCLSPNVRLVESRYPILNLWMAGTGQLSPEAVHINAGGQCACVMLRGGEVRLFGLSAAQQNTLGELMRCGENVGDPATVEQLIELGLVSWL